MIILGVSKIATHWFPALFNDDNTGLSDQDDELLDAWTQANREVHGCSVYYSFDGRSDTSEFCIDDVSKLMADCENVIMYN